MARQKFTGIAGLPLPRRAVKVLQERGLFAHALVSVEHQELAQRYVVRGLESGGVAGFCSALVQLIAFPGIEQRADHADTA